MMARARLAAVDGRTIPQDTPSDPEREIVANWVIACVEPTGDTKDRPTTSELQASLAAFCRRHHAPRIDQQRMTAILTDLLRPAKEGNRYPRNRRERVWPGYRIREDGGRQGK